MGESATVYVGRLRPGVPDSDSMESNNEFLTWIVIRTLGYPAILKLVLEIRNLVGIVQWLLLFSEAPLG
jgi:hypothetical protein